MKKPASKIFETFVKLNQNILLSKSLSLVTLGRFLKLLTLITYKNEVKKTNHGNSSTIKKAELMEFLEMKSPTIFVKTFKELEEAELLHRKQIRGKGFLIFINPYYASHKNFELTKELIECFKEYIIFNLSIFSKSIKTKDVFDILDNDLKEKLSEMEYLKIKSKFYKVDIFNVVELISNINGIYRLYKDNKIIYIGKSNCIKSRINQHKKDKDFDSFDIAIVGNNSDKDLYELYYIDKFKPTLNKESKYKSNSTIVVKELKFSNKIKRKDNI